MSHYKLDGTEEGKRRTCVKVIELGGSCSTAASLFFWNQINPGRPFLLGHLSTVKIRQPCNPKSTVLHQCKQVKYGNIELRLNQEVVLLVAYAMSTMLLQSQVDMTK